LGAKDRPKNGAPEPVVAGRCEIMMLECGITNDSPIVSEDGLAISSHGKEGTRTEVASGIEGEC